MRTEEERVDFLVIGSGIAGLTFANIVSEYGKCVIVTKKEDKESNTNYAQGGIACVIDSEDTFESHIEDTLKTGVGLCRKSAVETLVKEGPDRVRELVDMGADFTTYTDRSGKKLLRLSREGGHSTNRIVYSKDTTGHEVERILLKNIYEKKCSILENHPILGLISDGERCYGALVLNKRQGKIIRLLAKHTILATGGAGRIFPITTNPVVATGEGIILAYLAGARLNNLEFIQFHPTGLYKKDSTSSDEKAFLISEAVRGEGGILRTISGETFMDFHPLKSLAPRDIVAREIDKKLKASGDPYVNLDISYKDSEFIKTRFPNIYKTCLENGVDMTKEPIPVVPVAHYFCGGVETDLYGRTNIKGLYAAGEVACSGVHGANRLASNSLLEALVFSYRAAQTAISANDISLDDAPDKSDLIPKGYNIRSLWPLYQDKIREGMWQNVGIVRNKESLEKFMNKLAEMNKSIENLYFNSFPQLNGLETYGIGLLSELIVRSALLRKESRGAHYILDYKDVSADKYETCIDIHRPNGYLRKLDD